LTDASLLETLENVLQPILIEKVLGILLAANQPWR
jgi:hypothetical protein